MLVFICTDGIARIGAGGGVSRYDRLEDIAGPIDGLVKIDTTVDRLTRTLATVGMPWWERVLLWLRRG